jgi:hypothetical protein
MTEMTIMGIAKGGRTKEINMTIEREFSDC